MARKPAINIVNELFYTRCPEAFLSAGLADFFVRAKVIQFALKKEIESRTGGKTIRLKELASGALPDRWITFQEWGSARRWEVTLSDFTPQALPALDRLQSDRFTFTKVIQSLFDPLENLPREQRYDVFLTTYGLDSVWLPEDRHLEKENGQWFVTTYDIRLPSPFPDKPTVADFTDITIGKHLAPIDLSREPYGREIRSYYADINTISVNFPGGLLRTIDQAFKNQLPPRGIFISGDMAVAGKQGFPVMNDYRRSGRVAIFKVEDYGLAEVILEGSGYSTELMNLDQFLTRWDQTVPLDLSDHQVLVVYRNNSQRQ